MFGGVLGWQRANRRRLLLHQFRLGACNPSHAHSSLQSKREIGLLLPCTVVVHEEDEGSRVSILDSLVMVQVTGNQELQDIAQQAREKLERSLESLRLG